MVKQEPSSSATPARLPPSLKKQSSSTSSNGPPSGQRSIASFFSRTPSNGTPKSTANVLTANDSSTNVNAMAKPNVPSKPAFKKSKVKDITPVPSSDAVGPNSSQENENGGVPEGEERVVNGNGLVLGSSPSRKAKKVVSYAETDDEDDEDAFDPAGINSRRRAPRKIKDVETDEEDTFIGELDGAADDDDGAYFNWSYTS
jgi:DNA mismatch repair protein MSH6